MEQKKAKKKSGLFRSVSSLSASSRRDIESREADKNGSGFERIKLSVGRRSGDDFSNHPISVS